MAANNQATFNEKYLKLATERLSLSKELASGKLQFNRGQCAYLVQKLETAVRSATEYMSSSSSKQMSASVGNWKLLGRLAVDVERFVGECCKVEWIQAASMLMNAFEHVASLDSHLELCTWSFKPRNRIILGTVLRRELTSISQARDHRLTRSRALDQETLRKVEADLNLESISNPEECRLAISLLEKLKAAVAKDAIPDEPDLAMLSLLDQVELLGKVSNSGHHQRLIEFLRRRLEIAVANRTPHTPLALLPFWKEEEKGLESSGTYMENCALAKLRKAVGKPIPGKTDLDLLKVDDGSLKREPEKLVGSSGDVKVYKVKWLETVVAEKAVPKDWKQIFEREVSMLARLSHPNILPLLCYAERERECTCSIVLELMDKDLSKLIEERMRIDDTHPFSVDEAIDIMLEIAEGMDYLHRERVRHGDLKPENILIKCKKLNEAGVEFVHAKVADFGTSKTKEKDITLSHLTYNTGTNRWMAPEVIEIHPRQGRPGEKGDWYAEQYPYKCDVYSFSMVCYAILTGESPFPNEFPHDILRKVLHGERPRLLPSHCPPSLASVIKKCWRAVPMERPSFAEICAELRFMKGSLLIGEALINHEFHINLIFPPEMNWTQIVQRKGLINDRFAFVVQKFRPFNACDVLVELFGGFFPCAPGFIT